MALAEEMNQMPEVTNNDESSGEFTANFNEYQADDAEAVQEMHIEQLE